LPLSERARIEVYLPDLPRASYRDLLDGLEREFTYTFGGCTTLRGLDGSYLSRSGVPVRDRINLVYCDTPFEIEEQFTTLSLYAEELLAATVDALDEEAVLITVTRVFHTT
jgi:hypothetical protein